jgi:O-antigen ligase
LLLLAGCAIAAASAPSLLAYNVSPSPTYLNQALALALWAAWVLFSRPRLAGRGRGGAVLGLALALPALGVALSWSAGALPSGLALSALGLIAASLLLAAAGVAARGPGGTPAQAQALFTAFAAAWVVAGLLNLCIALIQVFAPQLADGDFIASSHLPGRAIGNLRQPNHLSSLLLWSVIATVALVEWREIRRRIGAVLIALFVFGVVLTASRTGVVGVAVLALWGLLDRRLSRAMRLALLATPLFYGLFWFAMAQWASLTQATFGGAERLAEVADTSARFSIWSNTLALLRDSPWTGVGFGEFNFAWTLTPFPGRSTAFFDHTHNLPLHLLVEFGIPLGGAVMALLLWALWRAAYNAWAIPVEVDGPDPSVGPRAAVLMVLMIGLHSQLEYPLWYAYFLLPTAWAWGYALGGPGPGRPGTAAPATSRRPGPWLGMAAVLIIVSTLFSVFDYRRVSIIFTGGEESGPLADRIERGRRSVFFAHHADYAAVTSGLTPRDAAASFANTTHYLLDGRLMVTWAEWLAAKGELDLARHLAGRVREFRTADADEFFQHCPKQAVPATGEGAALPFQCQLPQRTVHWREFLHKR